MAPEHRRWPVRAWIRLRLPPAPAPVVLMGAPPPAQPPGEFLEPEPVGPDPRKRVYAWEALQGEGLLKIVWDADDPEHLAAELRLPSYGERLTPDRLREFYSAVRSRLEGIGPVRIEAADPRP